MQRAGGQRSGVSQGGWARGGGGGAPRATVVAAVDADSTCSIAVSLSSSPQAGRGAQGWQ